MIMATTEQLSAYEKKLENLGARQEAEGCTAPHGFRIGVDFMTMHPIYVVFDEKSRGRRMSNDGQIRVWRDTESHIEYGIQR